MNLYTDDLAETKTTPSLIPETNLASAGHFLAVASQPSAGFDDCCRGRGCHCAGFWLVDFVASTGSADQRTNVSEVDLCRLLPRKKYRRSSFRGSEWAETRIISGRQHSGRHSHGTFESRGFESDQLHLSQHLRPRQAAQFAQYRAKPRVRLYPGRKGPAHRGKGADHSSTN